MHPWNRWSVQGAFLLCFSEGYKEAGKCAANWKQMCRKKMSKTRRWGAGLTSVPQVVTRGPGQGGLHRVEQVEETPGQHHDVVDDQVGHQDLGRDPHPCRRRHGFTASGQSPDGAFHSLLLRNGPGSPEPLGFRKDTCTIDKTFHSTLESWRRILHPRFVAFRLKSR